MLMAPTPSHANKTTVDGSKSATKGTDGARRRKSRDKVEKIKQTVEKRHLRPRSTSEDVQSSQEAMPALPLSYSKFELRCVMRFLCALGVSPTEVDRQLNVVYGKTMSRGVVFRWCQQFRNGRSSLEDNKRSGRPKNLKLRGSSEDVLAYIRSNRHAKLREIGFHMSLPATTMFQFIRESLKYKNFLGCWVPSDLSAENREERLKFSVSTLARCKSESASSFTNRIVVADQTWIHFYTTPLNKRLPPQKDEHGEVVKRKKKLRQKWNLKTGPSPAVSLLMTIFWDCTGVVAINFKERDVLVTRDDYRYSDTTSMQLLYEQVCLKRPGLLLSGLTLLLNEDLSSDEKKVVDDTGETITSRLNSFGWQGLFNPSHSPDLSPSDYCLFPPLKKHVSGKRFSDADAGKRCVCEWLWAQDTEFFASGVHELVQRWEKCVKVKGDYLDK